MLDFVPDVRGCYVVVEAFWVVLYEDLVLTLAFVLSLYELLINVVVSERLDKGTEFFLLIVSGRSSRIHKDGWTDH